MIHCYIQHTFYDEVIYSAHVATKTERQLALTSIYDAASKNHKTMKWADQLLLTSAVACCGICTYIVACGENLYLVGPTQDLIDGRVQTRDQKG